MTSLNSKQKEAAEYINGPLLILAGAGAGKTKTITERAINIVKGGVAPHNILCITFTNKAAAEMRERIMHRLNEEGMNDGLPPTIKTFHALGVYILREQYTYTHLNKSFTILDSADSKKVIKEIIDRLDLDPKHYDAGKIKNIISSEKNRGKSVESYREGVSSFTMEIIANVWREYTLELRRQQAIDFDDILTYTRDLLRDNTNVRSMYNNRYKYIQVDEYQDTNNIQYEITRLLVKGSTDKNETENSIMDIGNNICAVGDTDQNIYSWRGANLRNILNFEKDYKGAKIVLLEENYRSTANILALANRSIAKNKARSEKNLYTKSEGGDKIEVLPAWDEYSEADWIALTIKRLIDNTIAPNDIAILYRANFQSRILEEMLIKYNVSYQLLGTKFYERKEVKDMMAYMRAAINRNSLVDIRRVLEFPKRGIGPATMIKVLAGENLTPIIEKKIAPTYILLNKIVEMLSTETLSSTMLYVLGESGIEKDLRAGGDDEIERLANIYELISITNRYDNMNGLDALELFLTESGLHSDQDELDDKSKIEGVRMMTVHASKGLEFDYVFITGLEEDLFPHADLGNRNKSEEEKEEERRLFYVAVTRARKKLYLSYAESRTIFGKKSINIPSNFLSEAQSDIADYHDMHYVEKENVINWD